MSPTSTYERGAAPLCSSTPYANANANAHAKRVLANGHIDNKLVASDVVNGNVTVNIVSESTTSMDVLSGGESDAGDTLSRRNNNSVSSNLLGTVRECVGGGSGELPRRRNADITYFVAKELLMTERTYKRDLELITVTWSRRVSELAANGAEVAGVARACLALEPLALPAGAFLAKLEKILAAASPSRHDETEEPEYRRIAEFLYDHLSTTSEAYSRYVRECGALVGLAESARRHEAAAARAACAFETCAPLPLACLLLRPLHRLLHYRALAEELKRSASGCTETGASAADVAAREAREAELHLHHVQNHAALCQLQRDIAGYDKLLVAEREFIRLGCVYKHSARGLQQKMLFLFNDVLIIASKSGNSVFRAHSALALHQLQIKPAGLPHAFTLTGEDVDLMLNASNQVEFDGWYNTLERAIENAKNNNYTEVDTQLTTYEHENDSSPSAGSGGGCGGALWHVCWHRAASLDTGMLHRAITTQLSGYLLRKFKKSPGWQKLWVVFAMFTLFFYKSWQDETPLASLPLLGYSVGPPEPGEGIDKDFVFKLQFKNHVYFFRADSHYTYNRWTEVLQTATIHYSEQDN